MCVCFYLIYPPLLKNKGLLVSQRGGIPVVPFKKLFLLFMMICFKYIENLKHDYINQQYDHHVLNWTELNFNSYSHFVIFTSSMYINCIYMCVCVGWVVYSEFETLKFLSLDFQKIQFLFKYCHCDKLIYRFV